MNKIKLGILLVPLIQSISGQLSGQAITCVEFDSLVLTHALVPAGPVPSAFDINGVYPYPSYAETARRPVPVAYRFIRLENNHVSVTICPDLGGKVVSMIHKPTGREVLYVPEVIRPVRILPRFYFVAGGIEVSFPISHSPSQNEKTAYRVDRLKDRIYVTCGERELRFGMQWSVEYSLASRDTFMTQRVVLHNPGKTPYPWMSWSNAALPSDPGTLFHFPAGQVLSHSSVLDTIDWESQGPRREDDIREMTGYFWITRDANAFGAFTPSLGSGLYHVSDEKIAPGMKLWSYGNGMDREWATLSTASPDPYIEIQGGPIHDQSIKRELLPGERRWHSEYWIPAARPADIRSLCVPQVKLRPVSSVPLFGWARAETVDPWLELMRAAAGECSYPNPPGPEEMTWAPSGMEDLGPAFRGAIGEAGPEMADLWTFHYGTWLAGRGDTLEAIRILSECRSGAARALLGRLLYLAGDAEGAAEAFRSIREEWLLIHPQVATERDKVLRALGRQTLTERDYWLQRTGALEDEWVMERRVQWLIDNGEAERARELLLSIPFQKIHQSYTRTALWFQVCDALGSERFPIPRSLGEDRLAGFGSYREFE